MLAKIKWKRYINYFLVGIALILTLVVTSINPRALSFTSTMTQISYSIILATSLNLVVGFLGELSLGHAGFMCVGAYIGGVIVNTLYATDMPKLLATIIALLAGGFAAAVMGLLIGIPTLKLKGDYLAIVTLGFGEIVRNLFGNMLPSVFGGPSGLTVVKYGSSLCVLALIITFIVLILMQNMLRGKHGRAIQAIRDNEIAARSIGVNITYYKMVAFVGAAFFAGIAGVLFSQHVGILRPAKFDFNYSINILVMVVLGGMGNMTGSILAATALTYIDITLADVLSGDMAVIKNLVYALILILIVIWNNAPALRPYRERYNLRNLIVYVKKNILKHSKLVPEGGHDAPETASWDVIQTKIPMDAIISTDLTVDNSYTPDKPEKGR